MLTSVKTVQNGTRTTTAKVRKFREQTFNSWTDLSETHAGAPVLFFAGAALSDRAGALRGSREPFPKSRVEEKEKAQTKT